MEQPGRVTERRRPTRAVRAGRLVIGGGAPVSVQSMAKTDTRDAAATAAQVAALARAGCDLVRLAVPDARAAAALGEIRARLRAEGVDVPLCADVHFDHRLALAALEQGVDKLRLNPGNVGGPDRVRAVAAAARERGVPIRVGVNAGSLEKDLLYRYGRTPEALVESALRHVSLLEEAGFSAIVVSVKASDVPTTVAAYRLLAERVDYPLHLGVTEAGPGLAGTVKSAVGIGHLLALGIGDTIRVSLTGDPREEVRVGLEILCALGLRRKTLEIVSCPTCGRLEVDLPRVVREVQERLAGLEKPVKVAIMGCAVNGPGEAAEADVGLAAGRGVGMIFRRGTMVRKVREEEMVAALVGEVEAFVRAPGGAAEAGGGRR